MFQSVISKRLKMITRKHGFSAKLKYSFDNFMSRGGFSIFLSLMMLFIGAFVVMGTVRYVANLIMPDKDFAEISNQLWRVFLQISDAGSIAEDSDFNVLNKIVGIITIFLGLVLFSSLVAFITSQFEAKLSELRKGKSPVIEKNHTLILGFGDRVLEIIRELIIANESEKSPAIVVLSDKEKDEMDDFFNERIEDRKTTRIVTRSGVTSSLQILRKVSVESAKSIVILNDTTVDASEEEKELADARVLKTIMAVESCTGEENVPPIIAEIHLESKRRLAQTISDQVHTIEEHSLLAKLMVQTSRITGLAKVYDNLVGFEGDEFYYYRPKDGWNGEKYSDIIFHFPTCCLLGYRTGNGDVVVNPDPDTKFGDDFEALLLAEDDSAIRYVKKPVMVNPVMGEVAKPLAKKPENQLIVGWSKKAGIIVDEYSNYLVEGSTIDVVVGDASAEMKEYFGSIQKKHTAIKMNLISADIHHIETIASLKPDKYDNVIILKEDGGNSELRDSETIATLLGFRHYFKKNNMTDLKTQLISEVADSDNIEVIQEVGVKDFLISNKFVSKIYAQASEDPDVLKAYDELFKAEGSEIYIKPAKLFINNFPAQMRFADICATAIKRKETCFGVRIASEENDASKNNGIYVNPDKEKIFSITKDDLFITLAEDES
jgi:hypothetical protein